MIKIYCFSEIEKLDIKKINILKNKVSRERQARSARYYRLEDTARCIVGEILIRKAYYKQYKSKNITFTKNIYGKPYINENKNFHFNISHSGKWVFCGVSTSEIGIDVEEIRKIDLDISKSVCSERELKKLAELRESEKLDYFYNIWTLKESYIKAIGKGMSMPMKEIDIIQDLNKYSIYVKNIKQRYYIKNINLEKKYKFALCSEKNLENISLKKLKVEDIMN